MPARLTVTIPESCHESWAAMTPAAQGRHCAACDKVVVDFTRLTDAEVVAFLSRPTGPGCGRFRAEQLSRPLWATPAAPTPRRWLAAALALLGLGAAGPAVAQTKSAAPQEQRQLLGEPAAAAAGSPDRVIRGRVTDAGSGEGLPGVTVLLRDTWVGVSSDKDGYFTLHIPPPYHSVTKGRFIDISSIGYFTQQIALADFDAQSMSIRLLVDEQAMNERIVTGGFCISRWYTPRGLWQRLTQPFRHD